MSQPFLTRLKSLPRILQSKNKTVQSQENINESTTSAPENIECTPEEIRARTIFKIHVKPLYRNYLRSQGMYSEPDDEEVENEPFSRIIPNYHDDHGGLRFSVYFRDGNSWSITCFEDPLSVEEHRVNSEDKSLEMAIDEIQKLSVSDKIIEMEMEKEVDDLSQYSTSKPSDGLSEIEETKLDIHQENQKVEEVMNDIKESISETTDPAIDTPYSSHITNGPPNRPLGSTDSPTPQQMTEFPTTADTLILQHELMEYFFRKILIQRRLKEATHLQCIPELYGYNFNPSLKNGILHSPGLNWIIEDDLNGAQVQLTRSKTGTDKISMLVNGRWIPLRRRKKQRFLDDLARIQVSYSTITMPNLGPFDLNFLSRRNGIFQTYDEQISVKAEIIPTVSSAQEYLCSLRNNIPSEFLAYLIDKSVPMELTSGPYPMQPPSPIFPRLRVDPYSGTIISLSDSHMVQSVPWEFASCPPLRLSCAARDRYVYSLKRHFWGLLVRDRTGNVGMGPRLDSFCGGSVVVECLLRIRQEELTSEEIEDLERRIVDSVGETYSKVKKKWESERK
jgi:hypothetical protein